MRRVALVGALVASLAALGAGAGIAQEEEAETIDLVVDEIDTTAFPEVVLTVTLPFELADDVFTLSDFFVSEGGQSRSVKVEQVPGDRLAVVFALDTSGSMRGAPLAEAKNAVGAFVDAMPPGVAFALVRFGSSSELVVPFTTDPGEITRAVEGLSTSGETAMYDALIEAGGLFAGVEGVRRSLILLSDGGDTASEATLEQSIVSVLTSEAELVAVALESPENDTEALERLRVAVGGQVVAASNPDALEGIFDTLASDLVNQFRIRFTAAIGGDTELTVAVRGERITALSTTGARFPVIAVPEVTTTLASGTSTVAPTTTTLDPGPEALASTELTFPWYQTSLGLGVAVVAVFLGLFGVLALTRPPKVSQGVVALRGIAGRAGDRRVLSHIADRASGFAEQALTRSGSASGLRLLLDQAGLNLRVGELGVIILASAAGGVALGNLAFSVVGMVTGGVLGVLAPVGVVSALGNRRARRFQGQLADTLQLLAGALRAGFGINQAVDGVIAEAPEPTSSEFGRVSLEVQLGRELEEALSLMAERVQSEDLRMAAEAIEIHRQVGGDLAELLERVATTIREREKVRRQIDVLSAEGKLSAVVLIGLPFFIAALVRTIAPDYMSELTSTAAGQVMIGVGVVLMAVGIMWIRRIVQLRF